MRLASVVSGAFPEKCKRTADVVFGFVAGGGGYVQASRPKAVGRSHSITVTNFRLPRATLEAFSFDENRELIVTSIPCSPVDEIDKRPGALLLILRHYYGLSQQEIAKTLDVSFQEVGKYESGASPMSASKIQTAADAFNVPIAAFFKNFNPNDPEIFEKIEILKYENEMLAAFHDLDHHNQMEFLDIADEILTTLQERKSNV